MNLDGSAVLHGTPEQVWAVITDPAVLARTIPGCESLQQVGEDSYTMVVSAGVGAIKGKYAGEVRLSDLSFPKSYVMHAAGSGGPGSVRATVQINLAPSDSGTELTCTYSLAVGKGLSWTLPLTVASSAKTGDRVADGCVTTGGSTACGGAQLVAVPPDEVACDRPEPRRRGAGGVSCMPGSGGVPPVR